MTKVKNECQKCCKTVLLCRPWSNWPSLGRLPTTNISAVIRYAYLSIETRRTALDVGGWFPEMLGLAVGVVLFGENTHVFGEAEVGDLAKVLASADCVVGYNLDAFDLRVLAGYEHTPLTTPRKLDLMDSLWKATGLRLKLDGVLEASLACRVGEDGLTMVKHWKCGEVTKVIEGCCRRARHIRNLHEQGRATGSVRYLDSTTMERRTVQVDW